MDSNQSAIAIRRGNRAALGVELPDLFYNLKLSNDNYFFSSINKTLRCNYRKNIFGLQENYFRNRFASQLAVYIS